MYRKWDTFWRPSPRRWIEWGFGSKAFQQWRWWSHKSTDHTGTRAKGESAFLKQKLNLPESSFLCTYFCVGWTCRQEWR